MQLLVGEDLNSYKFFLFYAFSFCSQEVTGSYTNKSQGKSSALAVSPANYSDGENEIREIKINATNL